VKKKIGENHVSPVERPDEILDNAEHDIIGHQFPHSEGQSNRIIELNSSSLGFDN